MKLLRWIFFLPVAIAGAFAIGALLTSVARALVPHFFVLFVMFCSGLWLAWLTLVIGLKVAPQINYISKWVLLTPMILFAILQIFVGALKKDYQALASGLGMSVFSLNAVMQSPEKLQATLGSESEVVG